MLYRAPPRGCAHTSIKSSISRGSSAGTVSSTAWTTWLARSSGRMPASEPLTARPMGERATETMTASGMVGLRISVWGGRLKGGQQAELLHLAAGRGGQFGDEEDLARDFERCERTCAVCLRLPHGDSCAVAQSPTCVAHLAQPVVGHRGCGGALHRRMSLQRR